MAEPEEEEQTTGPFDGNDDDQDEGEDELPEVVDLSDIQASSYEPVPRGIYDGYIDDVEYGLSQNSGLPMLTWTLKFDYEDESGNVKERTLRFYTTLAGDGAGRTKATLARLDPELDLSALVPSELADTFNGKEVRIRVTIRPDRDDRSIKRNNVADIMPMDEE